MKPPVVTYEEIPPDSEKWCRSHNRPCTHKMIRDGFDDKICCNPKLGGILIACEPTDNPFSAKDIERGKKLLTELIMEESKAGLDLMNGGLFPARQSDCQRQINA